MVAAEKGKWVETAERGNTATIKDMRKQKKTVDKDEDDLVLCLLMIENKKESSVWGRCWTALWGWYDVYHWWGHIFFIYEEHMDWRFWCITPYHEQWYPSIWHHQHQQVDPKKLCYYACYEKRQASHEHPTSQWDWTGSHSMACEVLSLGRGKPVLPNMQTLAGKNNFK